MSRNASVPAKEDFAGVVARLAAAQKRRAPGSPAYSIYVNRPVGRRLAAAAYLAGLTPNAVTAISAVFTFSAIVIIASVPPSPLIGAAGDSFSEAAMLCSGTTTPVVVPLAVTA